MKLTRTVATALIAISLLVAPSAEAGPLWNFTKKAIITTVVAGVGTALVLNSSNKTHEWLKEKGRELRENYPIESLVGIIPQRPLYREMQPACEVVETRVRELELANATLAGQWHHCCRNPSINVTEFSAFVLNEVAGIEGMKANEQTEAVMDILNDVLKGDIPNQMKNLGQQGVRDMVKSCQSVSAAFEMMTAN